MRLRVILLLFAAALCGGRSACAADERPKPLYVYDDFLETGDRLDCRFTVERIVSLPGEVSALYGRAQVTRPEADAADVPAAPDPAAARPEPLPHPPSLSPEGDGGTVRTPQVNGQL